MATPKNNPSLPRSERSTEIPLTVDTPALAKTYDTTVSTDTEVALNTATKLIEVVALSKGLFMKYKTATGGTAVSTTNFDEYIPADSVRHYVRPFISGVQCTHVSFIEQAASATLICIEK